nr:uncharacterized protein LOC116154261 [Camelus dromedarius]
MKIQPGGGHQCVFPAFSRSLNQALWRKAKPSPSSEWIWAAFELRGRITNAHPSRPAASLRARELSPGPAGAPRSRGPRATPPATPPPPALGRRPRPTPDRLAGSPLACGKRSPCCRDCSFLSQGGGIPESKPRRTRFLSLFLQAVFYRPPRTLPQECGGAFAAAPLVFPARDGEGSPPEPPFPAAEAHCCPRPAAAAGATAAELLALAAAAARRPGLAAGSGGTRAQTLSFRFRGARAQETSTLLNLWTPRNTFWRRLGLVPRRDRAQRAAFGLFYSRQSKLQGMSCLAAAAFLDPCTWGRFSTPQVTREGGVVETCVYTAPPHAGSAAQFARPSGCRGASDAVRGPPLRSHDPSVHLDV